MQYKIIEYLLSFKNNYCQEFVSATDFEKNFLISFITCFLNYGKDQNDTSNQKTLEEICDYVMNYIYRYRFSLKDLSLNKLTDFISNSVVDTY